MIDKNISLLIIPLILVVTISGVPIPNSQSDDTLKTEDSDPQNKADTANTSNEPKGSGTIALNVPPADKDGTPRPMFFVYSVDKTTTSVAPTSNGQNTVALEVPPVGKNGKPRPMLFVYPNENTTNATAAPITSTLKTADTVAPTKDKGNDTHIIALKVPPVEKNGTPRPTLFIYSVGKTTSTTVAPITTTTSTTPASTSTTESTRPKGNETRIVAIKVPPVDSNSTPRPMLVLYSIDNTTTTTTESTTTAAPSTSTAAPTSTTAPSTCAIPQKNDTSRPMLWINSNISPSSDETVKRPENFLRGYNCPMRKGFFRYPDKCDVYIECKDYIPLTYICPDGLQFNPNAKKQEHVCDDPSVVKCNTGKPAVKESEKDSAYRPTSVPSNVLRGYTCPKRHGFFSYPGKCDVYIMCEDYTPLTYICPDGLQFNPNAWRSELVCDDPSIVKCEDRVIRPSEVRPVTRPTLVITRHPWSDTDDFSCPTPNGYFKFTEQCDEYVECRAYTPLRYICPDGLHFKTDALWTEYPCVHPLLSRCA